MSKNNHDAENYHIVGIGASAGGLEALEKFFSNMPADSNMGFVVIQHLSPDYKSHMVELLSKYTPLPVHEVQEGAEVEPNNIYLIPRRKNMTVFKKRLYLVDYDRSQGLNLPIDIFFESLAKDQGERSVGIILSGTGSDGTRGIRAIKEMGGMVMAQDETARFDGMPRSAISTQLVDFVAPPESMPNKLINYVTHPCPAPDLVTPPPIVDDEVALGKLFAIVRAHSDIDFTDYKPNTVLRRIWRRMSINQVEELSDYVEYLQQSPEECQTLFKEFLIGVTRFFRDPESFKIIQEQVLPQLFYGKKRHEQIRVWVTGCSTGEEAYSLAILFQEYMEQNGTYVDVKIFATDIDRIALEYASRGSYPESIIADVNTDRLHNFFIKKGDTYEIMRHVRGMVVFAYQNLIKDPPFSRMDLVSCRNLLIYLQPSLQKKVMDIFQFALKPQGFLFLGSSETVGDAADVLDVFSNRWKIFRYEGGVSPTIRHSQISGSSGSSEGRRIVTNRDFRQRGSEDWRGSDPVLRSLVEHLMPPCIVVDENQMVVHAFGEVRRFLQAPMGYKVSLDVLTMIRQELSLPLSTALHRALQDDEEVIYRNIKVNMEEELQHVDLTIRPFWERNNRQRLVLILFEIATDQPEQSGAIQSFDLSQSAAQRIDNLEQELQYTKENLQATIEELETSNEELQATNEELLAANEELQSTNEELQSVNEEMTTVNTEYQLKIRELTDLNNDMNNLLSNINIGLIFLDLSLKVRKFTPAVQVDVNLLEQDIDRPFRHISHNFEDVEILAEAESVLETLKSVEKEVRSRTGHWYILKVIPYLTHTNMVDGVVITLVDITKRKSTEAKSNMFESAVMASSESIVITNPNLPDNPIVYINPAFEQLTGYKGSEIIGRNCRFLQKDDRDQGELKRLRQAINKEEECKVLLRNYRKDGSMFWNELVIYPLKDGEGNLVHFVGIQRDVTSRIQNNRDHRKHGESQQDASDSSAKDKPSSEQPPASEEAEAVEHPAAATDE